MSEFRPNVRANRDWLLSITEEPAHSQEVHILNRGAIWTSDHEYSTITGLHNEPWLGGALLLEGVTADGEYQCELVTNWEEAGNE